MPRISHGEGILTVALNDLERDWAIAGADWRDRARQQFEEEIVGQMVPAGRAAARTMSELTRLLLRVVKDCG